MTLQASGAISLANVQTEFGGSNPIGINEYYGVAAGVPGSGTISLYDFYGKSAGGFAGFDQFVFGNRQLYGPSYDTTDSFTGNTITPGAGNSPQTFGVQVYNDQYPAPLPTGSLRYYQGGSLNTTWTNTEVGNTMFINVTFTFGGSSMRFDSTRYDPNSYEDVYGYNQVFKLDLYYTPLFYHLVNLTGSGIYGDDSD